MPLNWNTRNPKKTQLLSFFQLCVQSKARVKCQAPNPESCQRLKLCLTASERPISRNPEELNVAPRCKATAGTRQPRAQHHTFWVMTKAPRALKRLWAKGADGCRVLDATLCGLSNLRLILVFDYQDGTTVPSTRKPGPQAPSFHDGRTSTVTTVTSLLLRMRGNVFVVNRKNTLALASLKQDRTDFYLSLSLCFFALVSRFWCCESLKQPEAWSGGKRGWWPQDLGHQKNCRVSLECPRLRRVVLERREGTQQRTRKAGP